MRRIRRFGRTKKQYEANRLDTQAAILEYGVAEILKMGHYFFASENDAICIDYLTDALALRHKRDVLLQRRPRVKKQARRA